MPKTSVSCGRGYLVKPPITNSKNNNGKKNSYYHGFMHHGKMIKDGKFTPGDYWKEGDGLPW